MKIKKAIFPVAGYGTRFLPATKAQPKEMLPIVDKPVIQYLVEEAVASGIEQIIFITGRGKRAIEDHFDHCFELEHNLVEKGKTELLKEVQRISKLAKFAYVRQPVPRGDGDAILQAKELVGNEPCAVMFGDDLISSKIPALKQLIDVFEKYHSSVIALEQVAKEKVSSYGVISGQKIEDRLYKINDVVEKPEVENAPSDLIIIGKYIITPEVFETLSEVKVPENQELRLADAFKFLAKQGQAIYGCQFEGTRYDCGSKLGFIKAAIDFGLMHPELKDELGEYLKNYN